MFYFGAPFCESDDRLMRQGVGQSEGDKIDAALSFQVGQKPARVETTEVGFWNWHEIDT
jgi:hypothetical protein